VEIQQGEEVIRIPKAQVEDLIQALKKQIGTY
jgi:hypothetical protein